MNKQVCLDSFLFEELKSGNKRAFDQIFKENYPNLCRFAFSIVHDEDAAHSLVQDVFVKLWENRASLNHVDRLLPFLTAMTRNHSLNYIKREKRNIQLADVPIEAQTGDTTENQVDADSFEEHLIIALSLLSERCKVAFEYRRFENLTSKEIALKMDISVKGVEALIGRALKSLRISLADFLPSAMIGKTKHSILFAIIRVGKVALAGISGSFPK
ncbi:MAG: RNA polymerase sigma-70 factor [Prolixibacteraceae bacterium]